MEDRARLLPPRTYPTLRLYEVTKDFTCSHGVTYKAGCVAADFDGRDCFEVEQTSDWNGPGRGCALPVFDNGKIAELEAAGAIRQVHIALLPGPFHAY